MSEWTPATLITSVLTLSYSPRSSFVTADLALRQAKDASRGSVGTFSTNLLDEGSAGISTTSTDEVWTGSGLDGFGAGGGGGRRLLSSVVFLDDVSAFLFLPIVSGASSCWLIIFLSFSLLSLAVAIPAKHN
jgi:hypothetical protein